jgi:hypothetical protein
VNFSQLVAAYSTFDPASWLSVYRQMPIWAGAVCAAAGLALLLFGNGQIFRLVAAPAAAAVGYFWAPLAAQHLGVHYPVHVVSHAAALFLGALGFLVPSVAVFLGAGLASGLAAGSLVSAKDWMLAFVPGFLLGGTIATAARELIAAVVTSAVGAWLFILGVLVAFHTVADGMVSTVSRMPWAVLAAAASFAFAGAIFQLFLRRPLGRHQPA